MKRLILSIAALALVLPSLALACHVTEVTGNADCQGWSMCATVSFSGSVYEGTLNYTVHLLDDQNQEVNTFELSEVVSRPQDSCAGEYTFCFEGQWEGTYQSNGFLVKMEADLNGGASQCFQTSLSCTVDSDDVSFGAVKALYR